MEKTYTQEEVAKILLNVSSRNDFINDVIESSTDKETDANYERYLNSESRFSEALIPGQEIQKITREEYKLLEFCHNTNIKEFLREEFRRNPINPQDAQDSYEQGMINYYKDNRKQWL